MTLFALGVAVSVVVAGRLVGRVGAGWPTVSGLATTVVLAGRHRLAAERRWRPGGLLAAGPLLLAGLGGGMVTSPNATLTLEAVPVRMAGAAGGALQTASSGSAPRSAPPCWPRSSTGSSRQGHAYPAAVSDALLCACGLMMLALLLAIAELWHRRSRGDRPTPQPPHHLHLT